MYSLHQFCTLRLYKSCYTCWLYLYICVYDHGKLFVNPLSSLLPWLWNFGCSKCCIAVAELVCVYINWVVVPFTTKCGWSTDDFISQHVGDVVQLIGWNARNNLQVVSRTPKLAVVSFISCWNSSPSWFVIDWIQMQTQTTDVQNARCNFTASLLCNIGIISHDINHLFFYPLFF